MEKREQFSKWHREFSKKLTDNSTLTDQDRNILMKGHIREKSYLKYE